MQRYPVIILFLICIVGCAGADPISITEFCPDPYLHDDTDEYLWYQVTVHWMELPSLMGRAGFGFHLVP